LFERYLDAAGNGSLRPLEQLHARATYTCARTPEDGEIAWAAPTDAIVRLVRALAPPGPGAYTYFERRLLRVLAASALSDPRRYEGRIPGRLVARDSASGIVEVLSGDGIVRIEQVEAEGIGVCPPASVIKSIRAHLGVRPAVEIAQLHRAIAAMERRLGELEARLPTAERSS
jgi:methionyl-tRNA formyltransferase